MTDGFPVHPAAARHIHRLAALLLEQIDRVRRQQTAIPLGAFVTFVTPLFPGQIAGRLVGEIGDRLHELVVELHRRLGGKRHAFLVKRILQPHHAEANRPVAQVRVPGRLRRVKVDVDDVVQRAHGDANCFPQLGQVEFAALGEMIVEHDRAQVADSRLVAAGVERDLGAEVGTVDDPGVILRAADVAGVLERDPRMARLEDHLQHALPQIDGGNLLAAHFAALGLGLVCEVAFLEIPAVSLVQIRRVAGAKQRPVLAGFHPLHEQVGNPVGCVHVVRAPAVVAGVFAQLEKLANVVVPCLEISTTTAPPLAALIDRHQQVVVQFQEWNNALAPAVGAPDVAAHSANRRPTAPQATGPL